MLGRLGNGDSSRSIRFRVCFSILAISPLLWEANFSNLKQFLNKHFSVIPNKAVVFFKLQVKALRSKYFSLAAVSYETAHGYIFDTELRTDILAQKPFEETLSVT